MFRFSIDHTEPRSNFLYFPEPFYQNFISFFLWRLAIIFCEWLPPPCHPLLRDQIEPVVCINAVVRGLFRLTAIIMMTLQLGLTKFPLQGLKLLLKLLFHCLVFPCFLSIPDSSTLLFCILLLLITLACIMWLVDKTWHTYQFA